MYLLLSRLDIKYANIYILDVAGGKETFGSLE